MALTNLVIRLEIAQERRAYFRVFDGDGTVFGRQRFSRARWLESVLLPTLVERRRCAPTYKPCDAKAVDRRPAPHQKRPARPAGSGAPR